MSNSTHWNSWCVPIGKYSLPFDLGAELSVHPGLELSELLDRERATTLRRRAWFTPFSRIFFEYQTLTTEFRG